MVLQSSVPHLVMLFYLRAETLQVGSAAAAAAVAVAASASAAWVVTRGAPTVHITRETMVEVLCIAITTYIL